MLKKLLSFCILMIGFQTQCQAFNIVPRAEWGAKNGISSRMLSHSLREIVVHHTGVRQQSKYTLRQKLKFLQEYSQGDKGWGDVPYHFYIDMHGDVAEGRELAYSGDTNTSYNPANRIHIVVEGDLENEKPSQRQLDNLRELVLKLQSQHALNPSAVTGHMDHASTDCPGRHLAPFVASLRGGTPYCSGAEYGGECYGLSEVYLTTQSFLQSYGCYNAGLDGQWGKGSRAALNAFNQRNSTAFSIASQVGRNQLMQALNNRQFSSCSN